MNCAKCKEPLVAHFKIERVARTGEVTTSAAVCSLTCMLGWAQDYAAATGMRLVIGVQQKLTEARRTWDTLKGMFKKS